MNLRDKKYIPYYLAGIIIILMALIVIVIGTSIPKDNNDYSAEIITEPEVTTLFMNGLVPYYENIPASAFEPESFVYDDEGRMTYADSNVPYYTGIDVSSHQGDINWWKVADDGIDFVIIRAGYRGYGAEGKMGEDSMFRANARGALNAGLQIGVYFYSQAITVEEAIEEAEFVLDIIEGYDIQCPVVFDWETETGIGMRTDNLPGNIITDCAVAFCEKIKEAGYTPSVYFNLSDAYERYDLDRISDYVFWYAQYKGTSPNFYYNYSIWQYTNKGSVRGINGNVDINICFEQF